MLALSHGFTTLAGTCYELSLAAAFVMKTVEVLGGCDCGGKVVLDVEAVSSRGVTDRRVLTAVQVLGSYPVTGDDSARWPNLAEWRRGSPDSSQQQLVGCRRWRGTK